MFSERKALNNVKIVLTQKCSHTLLYNIYAVIQKIIIF